MKATWPTSTDCPGAEADGSPRRDRHRLPERLEGSNRTASSRSLKILAVSSSGGVLLDMLALGSWLERHEVIWAAVRAADTEVALSGEVVDWVRECDRSAPWSIVRAFADAWRVLGREQPHLVVSAGTGVAVGYFMAARLRGVRTIWIDTFNVVGTAGRVGRLCARLASATLVQRECLVSRRPRAVYIGELY